VLGERLAAAFAARGFDVRSARTPAAAESLIKEDRPSSWFLDLRVGQDNGLALIPILKQADPATRVVVLTGYGSIATAGGSREARCDSVPDEAGGCRRDSGGVRRAGGPDRTGSTSQSMSLDRLEWEHINRVLLGLRRQCVGSRQAARLHRRTLHGSSRSTRRKR
jgi:two-component system response regulator RegA